MHVTLSSVLLFCLFSFLFGVFAAFFFQVCYAIFAALRWLPYGQKGSKEKDEKPSAAGTVKKRYVFGYFFFDTSSLVIIAALYLIFLYAVNEGVFRLYSLLLALCGGILFFRPARFAAYPLFCLLDRTVSVLVSLARLPAALLRRLLQKRKKKTREVLDETGKMV